MTLAPVPTPPDFTEDRLLDGRVLLRQPRDGFRAAIDSVLLAAAVPAVDGESVLEPGAGAGAAALCLATRVAGSRVVGIELQPALVRLAGDNIRLNRLQRAVDIMVGDLSRPPPRLVPGAFDHVMINPPHLAADRADPPPDPAKAAAHVEGAAGLADWLGFALGMLRRKGTLTMIHRADRLDEALSGLHGRAGEIVVFPLWPGRGGKPAKRVIVRARKGVATPMRLDPGMVLHEDDGRFTPEADDVLRGAALVV